MVSVLACICILVTRIRSKIKNPHPSKGRGSPAVPPLLTPPHPHGDAHSARANGRYPVEATPSTVSLRRLRDEFARCSHRAHTIPRLAARWDALLLPITATQDCEQCIRHGRHCQVPTDICSILSRRGPVLCTEKERGARPPKWSEHRGFQKLSCAASADGRNESPWTRSLDLPLPRHEVLLQLIERIPPIVIDRLPALPLEQRRKKVRVERAAAERPSRTDEEAAISVTVFHNQIARLTRRRGDNS